MDSRCQERADVIAQWIEELTEIEEKLIDIEASEDALFGDLFLEAEGPIEERKAKAKSHPKMKALKAGYTQAKIRHNRAKRYLDLAMKAGDWEYGSMKNEENAIKKRGA